MFVDHEHAPPVDAPDSRARASDRMSVWTSVQSYWPGPALVVYESSWPPDLSAEQHGVEYRITLFPW